ncbi:hypothetical protein ABW20_dc0109477 [Dactylellina cionopaga]|nr:hypothetical protein ABW20_dc0109477 [Dactylellina cionopaga]
MSIPPTKKRKREGGSANGAKLTKSIALKSSLKPSSSKPRPAKELPISKSTPDESLLDVEEDGAVLENNNDSNSSDDNDGDVSDTNGEASDSDGYDLDSDDEDGEDAADDEFPADLVNPPSNKRKRADPSVFATSMSKILSSHLTKNLRKDPILVRSKNITAKIDDSKLEAKAKHLMTRQKREALEKGRVKDVIPKDDVSGEGVKAVMEKEKVLRKIAQRGVIKLFNAVRAAQVKGEEARKDGKVKGTLGMDTRSKNVTEISKESFLDMISKAKDK